MPGPSNKTSDHRSRVGIVGLLQESNTFTARFRVRSLHEGKFTESQARHGGFTEFDQGRTAILETIESAVTVMLTSRRMPPFSLSQLTACGIDPASLKIIAAKGVIAPMAAYRELAARFIHVDTPGATRADMTKLTYGNRRKPLFPFEQ